MSASIHYLHGRPSRIGQFIRVGYSGYRQLETLHGQGRFQVHRLVVDAGRYDAQKDLIESLWASGTEIVLDPTVAELSALGRFEGAGRGLSWSNPSRPLDPGDFGRAARSEFAKKIASFAAERKIDVVLAPTHLLSGARDRWVDIDFHLCDSLRQALDAAGGQAITIDYPLIVPYEVFRDSAHRRAIANALADRPFDNLWVRASGFGSDATPVGVRRYITGLADFHGLGRPIVADFVGGLAGLAIVAFGAASGLAHGVGERERFDTGKWKARPKKGGGGQSGRLYLPGLDRHFKTEEAKAIIEARGGRRLLSCADRDCCPLGVEDMLRNPKAHFLTQRRKQLDDLEKVPELRRVSHFLDRHLAVADRTARQAARLGVEKSLAEALARTSARLDRMRGVIEDLDRTVGPEVTRAHPIGLPASVEARLKGRRGGSE